MQTTLLGLAITFIVALIAALIGPYFIDWNRFRPQFETEAARVIGAPVRVEGALDARLLPSPSLRLRSVVVGGANDPGKVRADNLAVEFSLGSLMRGEWRATELTINGISLDLGLDTRGRIDWPLSSRSLNLSSLSIDRLNLTGRVALHDAASRSTLELNDIAFSGDVRALGTSVRGDGNFVVSGTRYPFRISSGQAGDSNASRVHLTIDPGSRAPSIDVDGLLAFNARVPRFNGVVTLAGPAGSGEGQRPWRLLAKVKADPNTAQLDQIDASYGASDAMLKLAGTGDIHFGATPRLRMALSARQLDADRLLAKDPDSPTQILPALRSLLSKIPGPPLATDVELSADQIMLGGRPIQKFAADLNGDAAAWTIARLEFSAPGTTRVAASGQIAQSAPSENFHGVFDVESSDPDTFVAWLSGRNDVASRSQKPLRLRGSLRVDPNQVIVDQMKADIDGGSVQGRLAFVRAKAGKGTRTEADLKADRLDLDAAAVLVRALAGPQGDWPDEGRISLSVDRAISAGQELHPFVAKLSYDPKAITLEQLKVGRSGGLNVDGAGAFDRINATGKLFLNTTSDSVAQLTSLIAPVAPAVAARLEAMPSVAGPARVNIALNVDKNPSDKNKADANAKLDVDLPQLKGVLSMTAAPLLADVRAANLDALARSTLTVQAKVSAKRGDALPALLGVDHVIMVHDGPVLVDGEATGGWHVPIQLKAKLSGADLDAEVKGTLEPWSPTRKADLSLAVHRVDLGPLLHLKPSDSRAQNISLSSHVTLAGDKLTFSNLDSTVGGTRMRGRVAVDLGAENAVEGAVGMDTLDLAPAFVFAAGAAGHDPNEPLGGGLLNGWRGQLTFQALRGVLPGGIELQPFSGIVKSDGQSLTFDAMKGKVGGGDVASRVNLRQSADGVALSANVQFKNVDGSALHYAALSMPAGRVSAQMTLASQGRSASALIGALSGNGLVSLERTRIPGLDPHMFDVAISASDGGKTPNDDKLRQVVLQSLSGNPLPVASAQIPFNVRDGRLRVGVTTLEGEGAQAIVSGGYDIAADQVDIRAGLASTSVGSTNNRPEVQMFVVGPPNALSRSVDVTALSSWLSVRAIDRETRRLDAIEHGIAPLPAPHSATPAPTTASLPPAPKPDVSIKPEQGNSASPGGVPVPNHDPRRSPSKAAAPSHPPAAPQASNVPAPSVAPLPAPVEIRPAPGPKPVRPRPPLVLTPPAPSPSRPAF
ncbi:MAG: AsmA family protein [Rhizobiales bacterium]|nr:AsmA family protein [Hyphomicrobiales bacterium]